MQGVAIAKCDYIRDMEIIKLGNIYVLRCICCSGDLSPMWAGLEAEDIRL